MNAPVERMKKILALARRGVGGEKTTAEAMLARLMCKYSLTIADLDDQALERTRRWFRCRTEADRRLLIQIVAFVLGQKDFDVWKRPGKRDRAVDLSPLEYAEVDVRYEACKPALQAELRKAEKRVFSAFVHANKLGVSAEEDDTRDVGPVDMDELVAIMALMQSMRPVQVHRQIGTRAAAQEAEGRAAAGGATK